MHSRFRTLFFLCLWHLKKWGSHSLLRSSQQELPTIASWGWLRGWHRSLLGVRSQAPLVAHASYCIRLSPRHWSTSKQPSMRCSQPVPTQWCKKQNGQERVLPSINPVKVRPPMHSNTQLRVVFVQRGSLQHSSGKCLSNAWRLPLMTPERRRCLWY